VRAIVIAVVIASARVAVAQPAFAIGKPLPDDKLQTGTVTVRVIAGAVTNAVANADVTLVVNGAERKARSDASGRATFKDLPGGAQVQAKIQSEDKQEIASEPFPLPDSGGVRVMLSTKPLVAPMAGGGGGDPPMDPLAISGTPRPDPTQKPGTYSVRVVYDAWKDADAEGVPVALVGYAADDHIKAAWQTTGKDGRVLFTDLDRTGATSYFALALVRRGDVVDRLMAQPILLDAQSGIKLVLSAGKRDPGVVAIDDLFKEKPEPAPPDGKLVVAIQGVPEQKGEVELIDASTGALVTKAPTTLAPPDPSNIQGSARFEARDDVPAGSLDVVVHGGVVGDDQPLAGIAVKITAASGAGTPMESSTDSAGLAHFDAKTGEQLVAVITVNGRQLPSNPFELTQQGGVIEVEARWDARGRPEATLDVAPDGKVVYVETVQRGQTYRSLPIMIAPGRGARVQLFVLPRALFAFSLTSHIEDAYLAVSGRFVISNNSWAPFRGGPDGVLVPLPRGFKGAIVAPIDAADVAVDDGGFRLLRPIPPGQKQFHGAFSLSVEDGAVDWHLDLPYGAFQSGLEILQASPTMKVDTPKGVPVRVVTLAQGTYHVLDSISIHPHESMEMTIRGLPSAPTWTKWTPRIVGIAAVALMLTGLAFALLRRAPAANAARAARRQKLLDELVELDRSGATGKRRDAILAELESLWE
jgi:hypothetical protein